MRASTAIVGTSVLPAILLTAGLRVALSGGPEPAPLVIAAAIDTPMAPPAGNDRSSATHPVRAWADPPSRIERAPASGATTASFAIGPAEPDATGTLVRQAEADTLSRASAPVRPMAASERLGPKRASRSEKPKQRMMARAVRKTDPRQTASAGATPSSAAQPAAAVPEPQPVAMAGPLGDILRGLGFMDGPAQQR